MRTPAELDPEPSMGHISDEPAEGARCRKSRYRVETKDGWSLAITRYQPEASAHFQPLWGEPILLVHGFSQNRRAWQAGGLVRRLVESGADLHLLELRGHGHSAIAAQRRIAEETGRSLPADLDYGWDFDSYLLEDLPAAIQGVKRRSGRERIFYCGHSMGGILGYGHAGLHDDFEGLITLGAAAQLGRGFRALRAASRCAPAVSSTIDLAFAGVNAQRKLIGSVRRAGHRLAAFRTGGRSVVSTELEPLRFRYLPVDTGLRWLGLLAGKAEENRLAALVSRRINWLSNPDRVDASRLGWLLREGGEREARGVVEQLADWISEGRMRCRRTGYDLAEGFARIRIPLLVVFGDLDPLATAESTRALARNAPSPYVRWRPLKGNRHIELTMGHDVPTICRDIEALVEHARESRPASVAAG